MLPEKSLYTSVLNGISELQRYGVNLSTSVQITSDLHAALKSHQGAIILPPTIISNCDDYQVIKAKSKPGGIPDTTFEHLWACTKQHYGLTTATAIAGAASIPIPKIMVGAWVHNGSSATTNLSSIIGWKFFPRTLIRQPTLARAAKATFGTVRVFGVIGRGLPVVAAGLAVFDIVSIGLCAYEAENAKQVQTR
jgi:hypothetical protein